MATRRVNDLLQHLRQHVSLSDWAALSDGQLLERFLKQRDERAFETLLRRHGPMVLAVCRRVLRDADDAEDAFQATFLVLARKAGSIIPRQQVGNWLYGVAYRTALEARTLARRRRFKERQAAQLDVVELAHEEDDLDFLPLLDRELSRLPAKYRDAIVLCDLEDKTHKEAARILGWPEGTLSTRLLRGRALLAKRLLRYGLAAGGMIATHTPGARAAVPASLAHATRAAARQVAFGTAAEAISPAVTHLLEGVMRTMWIAKIKLAAAAVLAVLALGTGTGFLFYTGTSAAQVQLDEHNHRQGEKPASATSTELEKLKTENAAMREQLSMLRQLIDNLYRDKASAQNAEKGKVADGAKVGVLYGGKPASFWIQQLKDRKPEFRVEAVRALGGIAEEDKAVIPIVIGALKDRDSKVQYAVRDAVWNGMGANGELAVPLLIDALNDPKNPGRYVAPETLLGIQPRNSKAVAAVVKAAHSEDVNFARSAFTNLLSRDLKSALPTLVEALKDKTSPLNEVALNLLYPSRPSVARGGRRMMPGGFGLDHLMNDNDPNVRRDADKVIKLLQNESEPKAGSAPIR